jgi:hypothetical protein
MSAAEALRAAQAAGITIALDGDALLLEALAEPPQSVLDALVLHKGRYSICYNPTDVDGGLSSGGHTLRNTTASQ